MTVSCLSTQKHTGKACDARGDSRRYSKNGFAIQQELYILLFDDLLASVRPMPLRILIADDEASIRRAVRAFIESRSQFEVCEANDGTDAFHKAVLLNPDLIVLDLSMPKANGVEVALQLRDRLPSTPGVLYTMFQEMFGNAPVPWV